MTQVFSAKEENVLADYLVQASKMHYGLSTRMSAGDSPADWCTRHLSMYWLQKTLQRLMQNDAFVEIMLHDKCVPGTIQEFVDGEKY